jgi:hypothetical protein
MPLGLSNKKISFFASIISILVQKYKMCTDGARDEYITCHNSGENASNVQTALLCSPF